MSGAPDGAAHTVCLAGDVLSDIVCEYPLHRCIIEDDLPTLADLLDSHDINEKDMHGNTPLHLAAMKGNHDAVCQLLSRGAAVKTHNQAGWSPIAEAISYGRRDTVTVLYEALNTQFDRESSGHYDSLAQTLQTIEDFYIELKWDFSTWVPFLHRLLPSDTCRLTKRGSCLRVDSTLADFSDLSWNRGDFTLLFVSDCARKPALFLLDNGRKLYRTVSHELAEKTTESEVSMLMSTDIVTVKMSTKNVTFKQCQQGWFNKSKRQEMVGQYCASVYDVHGLTMSSRKRREHLSQADVRHNKQLFSNLMMVASSRLTDSIEQDNMPSKVPRSLTPPPACRVTWREYASAAPGCPPHIGRPIALKASVKHFHATVAMCEDFPLDVASLIDVLNVVAPLKQFAKLREFVRCGLPAGFPVRVELPLLPMVSAVVTFCHCRVPHTSAAELFRVPRHYQVWK